MRCATCEADNPEAARFCAMCGGRLGVTCPHCNSPVAPGARFCGSCGGVVAIAESGTVEAQEPAGGTSPAERRRISVLFVDLENFSALAESLDAEEVRTIQSRYFEVARSIVATYGGTIEKFIGDAVMAVWGAPVAHEDDAERAVRAAVALVQAVARLGGAAAGTSLAARAAVTTGEGVVTLGATGQGMVAGDLVNVAARLQARAPVGGVLVDATTRERAPDAVQYESAGSLTLKGRTGRLAAFRATEAESSRPGRYRGVHSGPFVGRDRELRELMDLFGAVARDRRSRLVSVTGIAGIGKSRLSWEFAEWLESLPDPVAWHAGRAPAYGEGIAFAAVAEMVRRRIRLSEGAPPELARRQLASALEELVRDDAERRWMEPRLAVLLGRDAVASFDRDELFAAWRRFFERVSDLSPVVLMFEDLQWADPSLLDFVEHLATWTRAHPILIVALARPELLDRRAGWGSGLGSFTALHLERLGDDAMRELLSGLAPNLPNSLVRQILARAGGVPLYAVEVVRILSDDPGRPDGAERRRTAREPAAAVSSIEVPDSLHGLIAARIDALPLQERRLLLAAAVLGHRFRPEALITVAGADPGVTRQRIDGLARRELLAVDEELGSPGHGDLGFVQDLVREVAYSTLARSERRSLHLAAARYLEALKDDDVAEPLAGHLLEAHRLAPEHPDAVRLARRAVAAMRRAARDATRLHVPERALGLLEEALRLCDSPEQRAVLLGEAADASRAAARLDLAEQHLRELVALRRDLGERRETAHARARLASVLLSAQRNEPAIAELESAMRAVRDIGADASSVELAAQLARAKLLIGENRVGLEWAERALAAAERLQLVNVATDVLVTRGTARFRVGEEDEGLADLRAAIAQAQETGALNTELRARNNLAWLEVADDPRATMETARQGFELASAMGLGDIAVQLADVACTTAIDTGDWDWAMATMGEIENRGISDAYRIDVNSTMAIILALRGDPGATAVLDAFEPLPADTDSQVVAATRYARAWVSVASGAFDEARRLAAEAFDGSLGAERAYQLALAARASLWLGDRDAAAASLGQLEALKQRGRATAATSLTLRAGIAAVDLDPNAHDLFRHAREAWRELDLPLQLGLCMLDEHRLSGAQASEAAELSGLLRSLGADGLLQWVGDADVRRVSPRPAPPPPARSRRPTANTASRSDGGRRRRRAKDPPVPPG
jgi:class 3 adenylate cyclase/tetratricopeptide (TPR) repeat protein